MDKPILNQKTTICFIVNRYNYKKIFEKKDITYLKT